MSPDMGAFGLQAYGFAVKKSKNSFDGKQKRMLEYEALLIAAGFKSNDQLIVA
jgi:hypothetical protein